MLVDFPTEGLSNEPVFQFCNLLQCSKESFYSLKPTYKMRTICYYGISTWPPLSSLVGVLMVYLLLTAHVVRLHALKHIGQSEAKLETKIGHLALQFTQFDRLCKAKEAARGKVFGTSNNNLLLNSMYRASTAFFFVHGQEDTLPMDDLNRAKICGFGSVVGYKYRWNAKRNAPKTAKPTSPKYTKVL